MTAAATPRAALAGPLVSGGGGGGEGGGGGGARPRAARPAAAPLISGEPRHRVPLRPTKVLAGGTRVFTGATNIHRSLKRQLWVFQHAPHGLLVPRTTHDTVTNLHVDSVLAERTERRGFLDAAQKVIETLTRLLHSRIKVPPVHQHVPLLS